MNKDNYYLLDTNSFKIFINFDFTKDELAGWKFFCTSVQRIEIDRYEDIERRTQLLDIFKKIDPEMIISPAAYFDLAMFDFALFATPENAEILESLKQEIDTLDREAQTLGKKVNKQRDQIGDNLNRGADAMVVQAAMLLGKHCFVITTDRTLRRVCKNHSIQNARPNELLKKIRNTQSFLAID